MRVWIDDMALSTLATAEDGAEARRAQVKIAQRLADQLDGVLVWQRDGSYFLDAGPIQGAIPVGGLVWPSEADLDEREAAAQAWLTMLAGALNAELHYRDGEWYLVWPEKEEEAGA